MAPTGYGFFWNGIASPLPLNAAALDEEAATASMCSRVATNYYRHLFDGREPKSANTAPAKQREEAQMARKARRNKKPPPITRRSAKGMREHFRRKAKALELDEDETPKERKKKDKRRREAAAYLIGLLQNVRDALEDGITWEQINHAILSLKREKRP